MSFRTPQKLNTMSSSSSKGLVSDNSTMISTIKKQSSYINPDETLKKNRSVTFQNSCFNNDTPFQNNHIDLFNTQFSNNNQFAKQRNHYNYDQLNENQRIGNAIKDIVQNANDKKYQIYQQQVERQKLQTHNQPQYPQKSQQRRTQHCSNDIACSLKQHHNHQPLQQNEQQKPSRRDLEEYNYEQMQKMKLQEQFRNTSFSSEMMKTPEKCYKKNQQKVEENKQMNEKDIQQSLLVAARGISGRTFLKIQACLKPHPVLMSYCLSLISLYKDTLQISDCKIKKLENNWREIQDIFQHHAPLISALDNIESLLKQRRIDQNHINKSKEYLEKADYLKDKIKDTQMYQEIINPIDIFLKSCEQAIIFYNNQQNKINQNQYQNNSNNNQNQYQNNSNYNQIQYQNSSNYDNNAQFSKFDFIMQQKMKQEELEKMIMQSDLTRRKTCGNLNQKQFQEEQTSDEDNLGQFSPDLSPIQHPTQFEVEQVPNNNNTSYLQLQRTHKQQQQYQDYHKRRQSENVYKYQKCLTEKDEEPLATQPLDKLQMDYYKKIKKYIKRMEEIEKIKDEIWKL